MCVCVCVTLLIAENTVCSNPATLLCYIRYLTTTCIKLRNAGQKRFLKFPLHYSTMIAAI